MKNGRLGFNRLLGGDRHPFDGGRPLMNGDRMNRRGMTGTG
ncbi:MAG: hypothetical protein WCL50_01435 [Spirochaetota bacterium]